MITSWNESRGLEMHLGPDEVHIWLVDMRYRAASLQALSLQERARAGRFLHEKARQRYIVSHLAMRDILSRYLQTPPNGIAIFQPEPESPVLHPTTACVQFPLVFRALKICASYPSRAAQV